MTPLLSLAVRCERSGADGQASLIEQAFEAIHGPRPIPHLGMAAYRAWSARHDRLQAMLEAEAYESAAIALIDPNRREWGVQHCNAPRYPGTPAGSTAKIWRRNLDLCMGKAAPTALAILSAELRARASEVQG